MEFNVFTEELCDLVGKNLGNEYEVSSRSVTKNNGVILTGIMAKREGCNVYPTLYINDIYEEDISDEDIRAAALRISDSLRNASLPPAQMLDDIFEFEAVKGRIAIKLINSRKNEELLKEIPHREYLNLSIVYYIDVDDLKKDCRATVLIRDAFLKQWNIDEEELHEQALSNMRMNYPDKLMTMKEIFEERFSQMCDIDTGMYVLSNSTNTFGASAMIYGAGIKRLSRDLDRDLFILPSSVHELIILPQDDNTDASSLLDIVCQVNKYEVSEDEILADSVYLYDRLSDSVRLVLEMDQN